MALLHNMDDIDLKISLSSKNSAHSAITMNTEVLISQFCISPFTNPWYKFDSTFIKLSPFKFAKANSLDNFILVVYFFHYIFSWLSLILIDTL